MTVTAERLPWTERQALGALLEGLADQFPTRRDFDLWRAGVLGGFVSGAIGVVGVYEAGELVGGLLHQGHGRYHMVLASLGRFGADGLRGAFSALADESDLIVWDEDSGPGWNEALADLGAQTYERQTFVQVLERVEFMPAIEDGLEVLPWGEEFREAVLATLAAANEGTLEGFFLTAPRGPTLEHCLEGFSRVLDSAEAAFLPWASFVAWDAGCPVGTLLCVQGDHEKQGLLFDLWVAPEARGRGLSRRLVQSMQRTLLARGYAENQFLTTAANAPVHRLYRSEEIASAEALRGGFWLR